MAIQFSDKSLEKLSEPDKLDTYIRVATPGAWMVLAAVVLVISALVVWSLLGEVDGVTVFQALFG